MNNCNCDNHTPKAPCLPAPKTCRITLRTAVIPANLGSNAEGAPYAPALGAYYNTVVLYQATGAVYLYDSNGVYTQIEPDNYKELVAKVDGLAEALTALQEKEQSDVDNLQININQLANKEAEDVENLQTNINQVANDLEDYKNSPDVRFIEATYAALEAMDKTGVGDKDYARVLQDENHENASTYYQFDSAAQTWNYIGEVGDYYTKAQVDAQLAEINTTKLNELADIKAIGENLELTEDGTLNATGGGGSTGETVYVNTATRWANFPSKTGTNISYSGGAPIMSSTTQVLNLDILFELLMNPTVFTEPVKLYLVVNFNLGNYRISELTYDPASQGEGIMVTGNLCLRPLSSETPVYISVLSDREEPIPNGLRIVGEVVKTSYSDITTRVTE